MAKDTEVVLGVEFGKLGVSQLIDTTFSLTYTLTDESKAIEIVPNENVLNIGGDTATSPITNKNFNLKPVGITGSIQLEFILYSSTDKTVAKTKTIQGPLLNVIDVIPEINFTKRPAYTDEDNYLIDCNVMDMLEWEYSNPNPNRLTIELKSDYDFNNKEGSLNLLVKKDDTPNSLSFLTATKWSQNPLTFDFIVENKSNQKQTYPYGLNIINPTLELIIPHQEANGVYALFKKYKLGINISLSDFDAFFVDATTLENIKITDYDIIMNGYTPISEDIIKINEFNVQEKYINFEPLALAENLKLIVLPKTEKFNEYFTNENKIEIDKKVKALRGIVKDSQDYDDFVTLLINEPDYRNLEFWSNGENESTPDKIKNALLSSYSALQTFIEAKLFTHILSTRKAYNDFKSALSNFLVAYKNVYWYRKTQMYIEKELFRNCDNNEFTIIEKLLEFQVPEQIPNVLYYDEIGPEGYLVKVFTNGNKLTALSENSMVMTAEVTDDNNVVLKPKLPQKSCYIVIEGQLTNSEGKVLMSKVYRQIIYIKQKKYFIHGYETNLDIKQATLDKIVYLSQTKNVDMETVYYTTEILKKFDISRGFETYRYTIESVLKRIREEMKKPYKELNGYNSNEVGRYQHYATKSLTNLYDLLQSLSGSIIEPPRKDEWTVSLAVGESTIVEFPKRYPDAVLCANVQAYDHFQGQLSEGAGYNFYTDHKLMPDRANFTKVELYKTPIFYPNEGSKVPIDKSGVVTYPNDIPFFVVGAQIMNLIRTPNPTELTHKVKFEATGPGIYKIFFREIRLPKGALSGVYISSDGVVDVGYCEPIIVECHLTGKGFSLSPTPAQNLKLKLNQKLTYTMVNNEKAPAGLSGNPTNRIRTFHFPTRYEVPTNNVSVVYIDKSGDSKEHSNKNQVVITADKKVLGKFIVKLYWDNYDDPSNTFCYTLQGEIIP